MQLVTHLNEGGDISIQRVSAHCATGTGVICSHEASTMMGSYSLIRTVDGSSKTP